MTQLVYSDDHGNTIYGEPEKVIGKYIFNFKGKNSKVVIGNNVVFKNVTIKASGNHNLIHIGDNSMVYGELLASHDNSQIIIGNKLKCNAHCRIHASEGKKILIGDNCLFSNVRFRTSDSHSILNEKNERVNGAKDINIGNKVWIAEDVYIYKGAIIGSGSVIGARSTVTSQLPSNSVCIGTPCKPIKNNISWCDKLV